MANSIANSVDNFFWHEKESAIFYLYQDYTSKIFPSELHKIFPDGKKEIFISAEKQKFFDKAGIWVFDQKNKQKWYQEKQKQLKENGQKMMEVDIKNLGIDFSAKFQKINFYNESGGISARPQDGVKFFSGIWEISATLNEKKILSTEISSCLDYPEILFRAFSLPDKNFLLIVLTKVDHCDQIGRTSDTLFFTPLPLEQRIHESYFLVPDSLNYSEKKIPDSKAGVKVNLDENWKLFWTAKNLNLIGFSEHQNKNFKIAQHFFQAAYLVDKKYSVALWNLSCAKARLKETAEAIKYLEELLRNFPEEREKYRQKIINDADIKTLPSSEIEKLLNKDFSVTEIIENKEEKENFSQKSENKNPSPFEFLLFLLSE